MNMEVLGRRISRSGMLHLVEAKNSTQHDWVTMCGRNIPSTTALAPEKFEGEHGCCNVCILMQNRKKPTLKMPEIRF